MKHVLAGTLAILAVPAMAQGLDCQAVANSPGLVPDGYAEQCLGTSPSKASPLPLPFIADATRGGLPGLAYGVQLSARSDFATQGFYRFTLDTFTNPVPVNVELGFANTYGLDFDPAGTRLYGIQRLLGGSPHRISTINRETGVMTSVGFVTDFLSNAPRDQITGLSIDPRTGQGWITSVDVLTNNPQLTVARLWRINLHSGSTSFAARLLGDEPRPIFIDLAVDCQGRMFAHNISDDSLYQIDTATGATTRVGGHGLNADYAQGMDFNNADGQLYTWLHTGEGNTTLGTFDLETGGFNAIAPGPAGQWKGAIEASCPSMTIDPGALTGGWYAPYTAGQGFTARYFPNSGDLFMPWFTFAIAEEDDDDDDEEQPNLQRWYALYGQIDPDSQATEMELSIVQSTDGSFDQPPGATSQVVGQARLSMLSCSQIVLDYDFDEGHNEGVAGRIGLARLLPAGQACTDHDAQVRLPTRTYDPLLTGSWYDPNTAGQGLELFRIAQNTNANEFGLLYGAWFTFAPEDTEDTGPLRQRWFTLDGQTVQDDGSIKVNIVYTPGGSFDDQPTGAAGSWGTAELKSVSCNHLKLSYEFLDAATVGEWRDLSGEIDLFRLGPCPVTE